MKRQSLFFTAPEKVEIVSESFSGPAKGQALVRNLVSAISSGTEMLLYRGLVPEEMPLDASIEVLQGSSCYPFKYGYASVGEVIAVGEDVPEAWLGKQVFKFNPHESAFIANLSDLIPLPEGLSIEDALFLPNMETAVNFLQDGRPVIGEAAAVWGLGVIGLLTTALLVQFPLGNLVTFDRFHSRRQVALALGARASLSPEEVQLKEPENSLFPPGRDGFDLVYELSGSPSALDQSIAMTGFDGRIVIGSWYGKKTAELSLGGAFHRSRIKLISSQVSTISPELSGRWTKNRRFEVAWQQLAKVQPSRWITQVFPFEQAAEAYRKIAQEPQETIQVVLKYS
ncbi:MAG: zinc-binding dehydrogenase [Anaerolineae bacterium]|nr:zinc-binding dehydrogenase [Anaerolineae bacterium]